MVRRWVAVGRRAGPAAAALAIFLCLSGASVAARAATAEAVPGIPTLALGAFDLQQLGYTVQEFFISGEAQSYGIVGSYAPDGRWAAEPMARAPYVTRIVVVRPKDPKRFNGSVVVEWLNVTAGGDGAPDWSMTHRELTRDGFAWVGVSAQKVGLEGGPSLSPFDMSLKKVNPARYGGLHHPGDAFSYDIFSQAGRIVREASADGVLGPLAPKRVIAAGGSQSASYLTTYINAVDPAAKVYDGFFVHSRFGTAARLDGASTVVSPRSSLPQNVRFRPDLRTPVLAIITEADLIGSFGEAPYASARQPQTARLRVWEIAGTAHADNYVVKVAPIDSGSAPVASLASAWAPTSEVLGMRSPGPINFAPQHHYVAEAAIRGLDRWIRTGRAPAPGPAIALGGEGAPMAERDDNGLAEGGVRSPWMDVPTARLAGTGNSSAPMLALFGVGEPFSAAKLDQLYPGGKAAYLQRFGAALDGAIAAGFVLPADRQEILDLATGSYVGSR